MEKTRGWPTEVDTYLALAVPHVRATTVRGHICSTNNAPIANLHVCIKR
jgi:hypothetical protein